MGEARRAALLALAVFSVYLLAALAGQRVGLVWEPAILILPAGAFVLWRWIVRRPIAEIGLRRATSGRQQLLVPGIAALALSTALVALEAALGLRRFGALEPSALLWAVVLLLLAPLVAGLLTAVHEEVVFRGFYQRVLALAAPVAFAIAGSAALFAAAHLPMLLSGGPPLGLPLALRLVALFAFGLLMSWTVLRSGALWFAIAWHAGSNYPPVAAQFLAGAEPVDTVAAELLGLAALAVQAGAVFALLGAPAPAAHPAGGATARREGRA